MSDAAQAAVLFALALGSAFGALRCLADRLLASAAIYAVIGCALVAVAAKAALAAI